MEYITGYSLNGLLYQLYSTSDLNLDCAEYRIDLWDFVGSQSKAKLLDFDYVDLLRASNALHRLYSGSVSDMQTILDDVKPLYMCFMHYMSVIGIKVYLTSGIKLKFTIPNKLYDTGSVCELIDASEGSINILDHYHYCTDLNYYISIIKNETQKFNYKTIDVSSIDFEYLSKLRVYYESYTNEVMVIERR